MKRIFGEGKYLVHRGEKNGEGKGGKKMEKGNIQKRKIFGPRRKKIFEEGKYLACRGDENGEGKGGNYSEQEK